MAAANPAIMPNTQSDPLAEMRDIHLPVPIADWPPAPGWWILAILAGIAVLTILYWLWRRYKANAYRREALRELEANLLAYQQHQDVASYLEACQSLLKRVALTRYDRDLVASLNGEAWVAFLDKSANTNEFSMGAGSVLMDGGYQPSPSADVNKLHHLASLWIRKHKPLTNTASTPGLLAEAPA